MSIVEESTYIYGVSGYLPDSPPGSEEYVNYAGIGDSEIVAFLVAHSDLSPRRYLAIVAGSSYNALNATQCAIDFTPMLFNISVGIANRNISVVPAMEIADINPERNLTRTVVEQVSGISTIETTFYTSVVGNALDSSIAGWKISHPNASNETATLAGLEQAFLAMIDDVLVGFGGAQYVAGNFSKTTTAQVHVNALRFGSAVYIYAIFTVNAFIVLVFAAEALRTRGWRKLIQFNYLDSRTLVVGGSMGGRGIADAALRVGRSANGGMGRTPVRLINRDGIVAIRYAGIARESSPVGMTRYSRLASDDRVSMSR